MKPEITIQKTISDRSRLATQLMFIGITVIGAFLLSGCQETSMVHNASFQNLPLPEKKFIP